MFEDHEWLDNYVQTTKRRLTMQYNAIKKAFDSIGVPVAECNGSLMLFVDFSAYLEANTWEAEEKLQLEFFDKLKWHVNAGKQYVIDKPGWFRVMFTGQIFHTEEEMTKPFEELGKRLQEWKKNRAVGKSKTGTKRKQENPEDNVENDDEDSSTNKR